MISWWVLAGTVCVLGYLWYRVTYKERLELAAKIPSPTYYPIIGHLWLIMDALGDFDEIFRRVVEMSKDYPKKVAHLRWMARIGVGLWSPEDVEVILSSSEHLEKSYEYKFFQPWFGDGLLISSGNTWKTHRRLIAPTFHVNVLKQFIHLFNRNSDALCEKLQDTAGRTVDIHDFMSESTVEILLETAMGVDRSTQESGYDYAMAVMKMCAILHKRHTRPWLWPKILFDISSDGKRQKKLLNTIHTLTRGVVKKRNEERRNGIREGLYKRTGDVETHEPSSIASSTTPENKDISFGQSAGLRDDLDEDVGEKKRMAFLDQLMESAHEDKVITEQEVEDQVNTIMFEGHDTTAAASSFFLSLMGVHQDIQEKCVQELREIFGDSDRPATFQDTLEMKYLERCIMETLRLFPPVPLVARNLNKNTKLPSGYVVPAGTTVVIGTFLVHRDPEVYPNPSQFNPDNFLPERCAKRHYYAFIPFSAGPRSCVGRKYAMLKLKILLSTVLRRYHVHADVKEADYRLQADIILKRSEGFPVKLTPRKAMASS